MKRVNRLMIRILKYSAAILLYFLFSANSVAQRTSGFPDQIRQKFTAWCDSVRWEEVYVNTDRQEYISGENMWFSIFLVDRQDNKPSLKSRIVYFELLSPGNMPVYQKRILIDKGFGQGQIVIPDTLSSGSYTVRAYTNRMKNFLPANCFMKDIKVFNAFSDRLYTDKLHSYFQTVSEKPGAEVSDFSGGTLSLTTDNTNEDTVILHIHKHNFTPSASGSLFYLFINTRGNISRISTENISGETTVIKVPRSTLIPGVNQFTVFDSNGNPSDERFLYIPPVESGDFTLTAPDSVSAREKISIEAYSSAGKVMDTEPMRLSISVVPSADDKSIDLEDYLVFGSEFGPLPSYELKGRKIAEVKKEEIDSILLKVRSNRIKWKSILSGNIPYMEFPDETDANFLSGRLLTAEHNAPALSQYLFMCIPGKAADLQYARTGKDGKFRFSLNPDELPRDLVILPEKPDNFKINIESPFSDKYFDARKFSIPNVDSVPAGISELSFNYQVMKNYGVSSRGNRVTVLQDTLKPLRFYGKPDISLVLDEYIRLPKMEEIFFELLPHVNLKKRNSVFEITISDRVDNSPTLTYPVIMIDGVIIKDATLIAELEPESVEKIDVVKGKYLVGEYLFPGIVNVITKAGDFKSVPLPDYMVRMMYKVTDPVLTFSSPDYSSVSAKSSRIPDFRNTLYWNPAAQTDKNERVKVEFWSSDVTSSYEIIVNGFDSQGKCISQRRTINVK